MVRNVHERLVGAPAEDLGRLLDRLGGPDDALWPTPAWRPLALDRPLSVGAAGGHGSACYEVTAYDPGRRVEFAFDPAGGLDGTHTLTVEPIGADRSLVRHVLEGRLVGSGRLLWPLAVRRLHDALLEDLLDRAERSTASGPARPARWSTYVRVLVRLGADRATTTTVPATRLLATALPRVDHSDAFAVDRRPGMPTDARAWVDAVFRDPPGWVTALMGLREALVGLVGIDRSGPSTFATVARSDDEVLLGTDERHLDFRASVRCEPDRVVLSTVVQLHNARGRAYFALVRLVHPVIVRAMLTRAAHRLSRNSDPAGARATKVSP